MAEWRGKNLPTTLCDPCATGPCVFGKTSQNEVIYPVWYKTKEHESDVSERIGRESLASRRRKVPRLPIRPEVVLWKKDTWQPILAPFVLCQQEM